MEEPIHGLNSYSDRSTTAPQKSIMTRSDLDFSSPPERSITAPTSSGVHLDLLQAGEDKKSRSDRLYSDAFSDAGSIASQIETYSELFQGQILQDLDALDLTDEKFLPLLSQCLKEFAVRLGHEESDKDYQDMKYIIHKQHE